jgi:hypothetical protein
MGFGQGLGLAALCLAQDTKGADGTASTICPQLRGGHANGALDLIDCDDVVANDDACPGRGCVRMHGDHFVHIRRRELDAAAKLVRWAEAQGQAQNLARRERILRRC